ERRACYDKTTTSDTREGAASTPPGPGAARHSDLEQRHGVHSGRAPRIRAGRASAPRGGNPRQAARARGLLPHAVETLDRQLERVMEHLDAKPNDLERYVYLIGLSDRNETLFYRTLMSDPARFVPIVYDPTVAEACLTFGHIYRRARGMYITREMKG